MINDFFFHYLKEKEKSKLKKDKKKSGLHILPMVRKSSPLHFKTQPKMYYDKKEK